MSVTLISAEQARQIPPESCAPPIRTQDAHVTGVGAAHGRVLPLVGNTRPYLYDITIVGTDHRIYADRLTDVLGVLIGDTYTDLATRIDDLGVLEVGNERDTPAPGDVLPTAIAEVAQPDEELPSPFDDEDRILRHQQAQHLLYEMALLRTAFATEVRIALQRALNADAVATGVWDQLSEHEREELTISATDDGGFPVGLPAEVAVVADADNSPRTVLIVRPEWRAEARLVINTGDYNPWTSAPFIESLRTAVDADGTEFEYPTDENVVLLTIDTEEELIECLVSAGYLTMDIRPAYQADAMYHEFTDDPVARPYLRRDQGDAVNA